MNNFSDPKKIWCITKEGERRLFYYDYEKTGKEITFLLNDNEDIKTGEYFELTLSEIDDQTLQIESIAHNDNPSLKSKGIPDALIPNASKIFKKTIISSKTYQERRVGGEYRTPNATKYWNRLVKAGLASYDSNSDRFILPHKP